MSSKQTKNGGPRPLVTIKDLCPIELLNNSSLALDELIPYLDVIGLVSLLRTSSWMCRALKPVMKEVVHHKSIPSPPNPLSSEDPALLTAFGPFVRPVQFLFPEQLNDILVWLVKYMPKIVPGKHPQGLSFEDLTRGCIAHQGPEKGLATILEFHLLTSLALEMDPEGNRTDYNLTLSELVTSASSLKELEFLEVAGQWWDRVGLINEVSFEKLSLLSVKSGENPNGDVMPKQSQIVIFIRDNLVVDKARIVHRTLGGTTELDETSGVMDWKHRGLLRITILNVRCCQSHEILKQCMSLTMDLTELKIARSGVVDDIFNGPEIAEHLAKKLNLVGLFDKEILKMNEDVKTLEQMMARSHIRLNQQVEDNECNQHFRKYLQNSCETGTGKNQAKLIEIVQTHKRDVRDIGKGGDSVYKGIQVFAYGPSHNHKGSLPPSPVSFYEPYYFNKTSLSLEQDILRLQLLKNLERIWIRKSMESLLTDEITKKILDVLSKTVGETLQEIRIGNFPELVFVRAREPNKEKTKQKREPDVTALRQVKDYFPHLRLVNTQGIPAVMPALHDIQDQTPTTVGKQPIIDLSSERDLPATNLQVGVPKKGKAFLDDEEVLDEKLHFDPSTHTGQKHSTPLPKEPGASAFPFVPLAPILDESPDHSPKCSSAATQFTHHE